MRAYDVHFHAFNLTHVNLTAFLSRFSGEINQVQNLSYTRLVFGSIIHGRRLSSKL